MLHLSKKSDVERDGEREIDRANEGFSTPDLFPDTADPLKKINFTNLLEKREELKTAAEENEKMKNLHKDLETEIELFKRNEEILSNEIRAIVAKERKLTKTNYELKEKEENWKLRENRLEQEIWLLKKMVVLHSSEKRLAAMSSPELAESPSSTAIAIRTSHSLSPLASPTTPKSPGPGAFLKHSTSNASYLRPSTTSSMALSPPKARRTSLNSMGSLTSIEPLGSVSGGSGSGNGSGSFNGDDPERERERDKEKDIQRNTSKEEKWEREKSTIKAKSKTRDKGKSKEI